jgi:hypothetical protein
VFHCYNQITEQVLRLPIRDDPHRVGALHLLSWLPQDGTAQLRFPLRLPSSDACERVDELWMFSVYITSSARKKKIASETPTKIASVRNYLISSVGTLLFIHILNKLLLQGHGL